MKEKEKSLIIAERIRLKYVGEVVGFIILIIFTVVFLILCSYLDSIIGIIICSLSLIGVIVLFIFDLLKIHKNNNLPSVLITLKKDTFTIHDPVKNLEIKKTDIIDITYKNKKSFIITPYYYSSTIWNYGTLVLFIKDAESTEDCYKLTLKNVANPDKVFDKLYHLLEWDTIEE